MRTKYVLLALAVAACAAETAPDTASDPTLLEASLHFDAAGSPQLTIDSLVRRPGTAPAAAQTGSYLAEVLDDRGNVIDGARFDLPVLAEDPPPQDGDLSANELLQTDVDFAVTLPWSETATTLRIRDAMGIELDARALDAVVVDTGRVPVSSFRGDPTATAPVAVPLLAGSTLDIAFVASGYSSTNMQQFRDDAARFSSELLTFEPFKSRASQIVFHAVENTANLGCSYNGRLITCNNAAATSAVNSAGVSYDKIVVIVNSSTYGGSGGSVAVAYNGTQGSLVFVHEFAHSLGGLLDEYVAYAGGTSDGAVHANCFAGSPPASAWSGIVASSSYYLECKYAGWYRSTSDSLMRSLDAHYFNTVSTKLLVTAINSFAPATADTTAPSVSITSPTSGAQVSGTVSVAVTASDAGGIAKVELLRDNVLVGSDLTSPFAISWATTGVSNGSHVLQARARDVAGNVGSSASITVNVNNVTGDTTAPTVSITSPANGATVSGLVTVHVAATDNSGTVQRVELYKNGTLFATDTSAPFDLAWPTELGANGSTTLVARAYDPSGNQRDSAATTVTVSNAADTTPPMVIIETPTNGARLTGGWAKISTRASDASGIATLTIAIDSNVVTTCHSTSCAYTVRAKTLSGSHTITAQATDGSPAANTASRTISVTR